jgi:NAD(P)-dependent dehydrogenase (short-subunit alcohol dehydrogenase family)
MHTLTNTFEQVVADFGRIDSCVTAAGIVLDKDFLDHKWEETLRVQMVNTMGTFFTAQLAAKQMVAQKSGGSIVMVASIAAHHAVPSQRLAGYSCSKGAVHALMQQLAVELAPHQIRVNCISPGSATASSYVVTKS